MDHEDDGFVGTVLFEPLTALAGGLIGGVTVTIVAWQLAFRHRHPPHVVGCLVRKAMH